MPKKRKSYNKHIKVSEDVKITTNLILKSFINCSEKEYKFPTCLSAGERAYIHSMALKHNLKSKSRGKGSERFLTIYKREGSTIIQDDTELNLTEDSKSSICSFLTKNPLTFKEKQDVIPLTERDRNQVSESSYKDPTKQYGRLSNGVPIIPSLNSNSDYINHRQSLPIYPLHNEIIDCINDNSVVIISGETGSGKTTQVPQYIMEYSAKFNRPCRIICCQPRRIAAVMTAERVGLERNVKIGSEVGFQIRHEGRLSPNTSLIFCTNGVLLRTLMGNDSGIATVTHIIIDEIHERDKYTDFLLISLRDIVAKYRSIKLILMSATVDTNIFAKYFNNCPVLCVPGRLYDVKEYFLEDILKRTEYMTKDMEELKKQTEEKKKQKATMDKWMESMTNMKLNDSLEKVPDDKIDKNNQNWKFTEMDKYLKIGFFGNGSDAKQAVEKIMKLVSSEDVSPDYKSSEIGITPLIVATKNGDIDAVDDLLNLGASSFIQAPNNYTALDFALELNLDDIVHLLSSHMTYHKEGNSLIASENIDDLNGGMSEQDIQLLEIYRTCYSSNEIDYPLILAIIDEIQASNKKGAVLVFLPGYDNIMTLRDRINARESKPKELKIKTLVLYSRMSTADQKKVFQRAPSGTRKIILSTNIAETSITIDDVIFVIDCGKVKELSFDSLSGISSMTCQTISKASARQRKGRAGRSQPGVCYHLFSSYEFTLMQDYQTPELLRSPIHELCLQTKLLAPANTSIADFLAKAIDPPSFMITRNAVQLLKTLEALDAWEDLTQLGHLLLDLPIDPHLGKMLVYSVILKCVDPVLTIVSALYHQDPFIIPDSPPARRAIQDIRTNLSAKTISDHMVLLQVFQAWLLAKEKGTSKTFCKENYLNDSTLEMIFSLRTQLVQQMRCIGLVKNRGTFTRNPVAGDMKDLNTNSENWAIVKAALCGGLYPNLAHIDNELGLNPTLRTQRENKVIMHPSSIIKSNTNRLLASLPSKWILFEQLGRSNDHCHIRTCTLISPITVAIFAGPSRIPFDCLYDPESMDPGSDSEEEDIPEGKTALLKLDDWITLRNDPETIKVALTLRLKWHALLIRRLRTPHKPSTPVDDAVVNCILGVLNNEENALKLPQPSDIGSRPRAFPIDNYNSNEISDTGSIRSLGSASPSPTPSHGSNSNDLQNSNKNKLASNAVIPPTRYFVIRVLPKTMDPNISSYKMTSSKSWSFINSTEQKIVQAFKEGSTVIIIFGIGSGYFQGYARIVSDKTDSSNFPAKSLGVNPPLPIEWIKRGDIPINHMKNFKNPLNEKGHLGRDGQEIEPSIGETICKLWDKHYQPWMPKNSNMPQHMYHHQSQGYGAAGYGRPVRGSFQQGQYQHSGSFPHPPPFHNRHK